MLHSIERSCTLLSFLSIQVTAECLWGQMLRVSQVPGGLCALWRDPVSLQGLGGCRCGGWELGWELGGVFLGPTPPCRMLRGLSQEGV